MTELEALICVVNGDGKMPQTDQTLILVRTVLDPWYCHFNTELSLHVTSTAAALAVWFIRHQLSQLTVFSAIFIIF